jgi:hypothetical protein
MTVLANVLQMRRTHARRQLHSVGPRAILRLVDARSLSTHRSARPNAMSRHSPPGPFAAGDTSVWLECNGELMEDRSTFFASAKRHPASSWSSSLARAVGRRTLASLRMTPDTSANELAPPDSRTTVAASGHSSANWCRNFSSDVD